MGALTLVAVFVGLGLAYAVFTRTKEIFCLSVREGRMLRVRGIEDDTSFDMGRWAEVREAGGDKPLSEDRVEIGVKNSFASIGADERFETLAVALAGRD